MISLFNIIPLQSLADPGYENMIEIRLHSRHLQIMNWFGDDLHKWTWWLNLSLTILPLLILWKIIDRKRLLEILTYGLLIAVLATLLDSLGVAFMLWDYPDKMLPITPQTFPVNYVLLPCTYMFVYQRYRSWRDFTIASTVLAALASFLGEPFFVWFNLYDLIAWSYLYSFPIYIVMALMVRWCTEKLADRDLNYILSRGRSC